MKNLYDVLRQKELELQQLQKEIEALRLAAHLLSDDESESVTASSAAAGSGTSPVPFRSSTASASREAGNDSVFAKQFP